MPNIGEKETVLYMDNNEADAIYAQLPESIRRYLKYDAPAPYDPSMALAAYRQVGEARTLEAIKKFIANETRQYYPGYPIA